METSLKALQQILLVLLTFSLLAIVFVRIDNGVTPMLAPDSGTKYEAVTNQLDITTPDYFDNYDGAINDMGYEEVGGIEQFHNITNNLTDLVGNLNVNQMFFDEYVNILRKKVVPVDIMEVGPFEYLENYRNPCWLERERRKSRVRCLPYFYVVGAPKCGTTDVQRRLVKHPDICQYTQKENHWLTRKRFYGKHPQENFDDYLAYFEEASGHIQRMVNETTGFHPLVVGDCSASTLWDNDYWVLLPEYRNRDEPLYTNADYIHHLYPKTKIIVMVRNPITRLFSDYLYFKHGHEDTLHFHIGVSFGVQAIQECEQQHSLRHCLYTYPNRESARNIRLRIGIYYLHIKEYLRVFPRDQIMVIKMEDYSNNTAAYMKRLFDFLDLSTLSDEEIDELSTREKVYNTRSKSDKKVGEMLPETKQLLQDFYRPYNEELGKLLGPEFNYNYDII